MKEIGLLRVALFMAALALPVSAAAQGISIPRELLPNVQLWKGEIVVTRTGKGTVRKDEGSGGGVSTYLYDRTVADTATVKVCGMTGPLSIVSANRELSDVMEDERYSRAAKTTCPPPEGGPRFYSDENPPDIRRPGSWSRRQRKETVTLHIGKKETKGVKAGWAHVSVWSDGKVQLRGGYRGFLDATKDDVTISKDVCTGTQTTVGSHQRTVPPDATGNVETKETENDKHHWVTLPALPHNLAMAVQDTVSENGLLIKGNRPIEKKQEMDGAYTEETHASWSLAGRDPCDEVEQQLRQEFAFGEAYADQELRDEAKSTTDYDYKIDQLACVKYTGWRCPPPKPTGDLERPGGGESATTDVAVNDKCELVGEEAFREKNKCGPPIIIDAILEHEKVHVRQCKAWGMLFKNKTPQSEGGFEQEAYAKSASKLLSWMEMFCRDRNLEPYRKQLRYLQTGL